MERKSLAGRVAPGRARAGACILAAFSCAAPLLALGKADSLDTLVRESSVIARVRVIATEPASPEAVAETGYRSVARIELLETLRGPPARSVLRLRFDNGLACPNVLYAAGEECLLFAVDEIDGTYATANDANGKQPVDPAALGRARREIASSSVVREVYREVRAGASWKVSLELLPPDADTATGAGVERIRVRIENDGDSSIGVENDLSVKLRGRYAGRTLPEALAADRIHPALFVRPEGPGLVRELAMLERERVAVPLELEPEERCEGVFRLKDLLPELAGVHRLHLRARAGRMMSEPVRLEMDFGRRLERARLVRESVGENQGPFRKIPDPWRKVRRFVRRHPALSSLLLLAALLPFIVWTAARVHPRFTRDGRSAEGAPPSTTDHGATPP